MLIWRKWTLVFFSNLDHISQSKTEQNKKNVMEFHGQTIQTNNKHKR